MRGGFWRYPVKYFTHFRGLIFRPFSDWGATTYRGILLLNFWRSSTGDERAKIRLKRAERDEICICLAEEDIQQDDSNFEMWRRGFTNNLLKKFPTAPVVEGPPIFIKTIAVGPLDVAESCVTGGTIVAIDRPGALYCVMKAFPDEMAAVAADFDLEVDDVSFFICDIAVREAIST